MVVEARLGAAAIRRAGMSRPVRIALETHLIADGDIVLDYGCGHGEDLRALRDNGIDASGWDPVHRPDGYLRAAEVVNLGYVLNVIETPTERVAVARDAWSYAKRALVIAVRTAGEIPSLASAAPRGDGWITGKGTFQRFYGQAEARDWLNEVLDTAVIPLAVGVFVAFKDEAGAQQWLDARALERRRVRRLRRPPVERASKRTLDYLRHADLLAPLESFLADRGRLPFPDEQAWVEPIIDAYGSLPKAFQVIRHVASEPFWEEGATARAEELTMRFALGRLRRRPKFSQLPEPVQRDVKALFGSYRRACEKADALLFSTGDPDQLGDAAAKATLGKRTPDALYVHVSAVHNLPPRLRAYVGCAEALVGAVSGATLVKLHLDRPRVSYLVYPDFDVDPHPALAESWVVDLRALAVTPRDYRERENPPILHRKELFVGPDYPLRAKFVRLTTQEQRHGLLDDAGRIGTRQAWEERLGDAGWALRGHRLVRARPARLGRVLCESGEPG